LNGGLFRENVENEGDYDVLDRTLPMVITDLIERTELDLDLDPAILESVFENTINHLSESENRQREVGAYYTPNDVTRLVNEGAVDGKLRDVIIESYTEELTQPNEFRAEAEEITLEGMLFRIEDADFPSGRDREECSAAVYAAREYLREHGPATKRDLVAEVMPDHPLRYDADDALEKVEGATATEGLGGAEW
jgi:hypothetical protein